MRNEPILVVMAAGLGSRFGGGIKQMASFGRHDECIIDYSLFDAYRAGFRRVVFIVNEKIYDDFREKIGKNVENRMEVHYVIQRLTTVPEGCSVPADRTKPWGTGHAVMCCREFIDAPFAAINGDDFYGRDAFQKIYDFLSQPHAKGEYTMVSFMLKNTLSENGSVSRGVCGVTPDGLLDSIVERTHIISTCDGPLYTEDGENYRRLDADTLVSMNMFGFTPSLLKEMQEQFPAFHRRALETNPLKAEYFLPGVVNGMLERDAATVQVLSSRDRWYGVTYREDKPEVTRALTKMAEDGLYPTPLWQ